MQLVRFAIVGAVVALTYMAGYVALLALGFPQPLANAAAFLAAVALQYLGQAGFTFRRPVRDPAQALRFAAMIGLGLMTAAAITGWAGPRLGLSDWMAALAVTLFLPVQNYVFMSAWVFSRSGPRYGAELMAHVYNNRFFDYIYESAQNSARALVGILEPALRPASVLDLGCGRGVWLAEWQRAGAADVLGVDGDYVDVSTLAVLRNAFLAADLTRPLPLARRFDLAQSLEVGEHLPENAAATLVDSLTRASDRVLFSAAVRGQGGEFHINEQPLAYWQALFAARGYTAFDCLRPRLAANRQVAPWYRYNAVLYINAAGRAGLPESILRHEVPAGARLADGGDALWRLRRGIVSVLPRNTVNGIARARAYVLASLARAGRRREAGSA
jgi:putative flippase GtrA